MNSTAQSKSRSAIRSTSRNPYPASALVAAPHPAMHEIKRSILKKLWLRMNREDRCYS